MLLFIVVALLLAFCAAVSFKITKHNRMVEEDAPPESFRPLKRFLIVWSILFAIVAAILVIIFVLSLPPELAAAFDNDDKGPIMTLLSLILGILGTAIFAGLFILSALAAVAVYFVGFVISVFIYCLYCFQHGYKVNGFCNGFFILASCGLLVILAGGTPALAGTIFL